MKYNVVYLSFREEKQDLVYGDGLEVEFVNASYETNI